MHLHLQQIQSSIRLETWRSGGCRPTVRQLSRPFTSRQPSPCPATAPTHSRQRLQPVHSFEGDAAKALKEAAALDELIDNMLTAKTQKELSQLVAENIFSLDAKFWMRIATRNDSIATPAEKEKLRVLADSVMGLVDAMVKSSEQKLNDSSQVLQDILKAAADENGEWYLPLTPEQVQRVRESLDRNADSLDEALLSNAFAWIKKCTEDRFDSMVQLIQKVLQLYAARALRSQEQEEAAALVSEVVWAQESDWEGLIRSRATHSGGVSEVAFMEALQKKMEGVVLGMASGSYAQRVQAEYLKEIESRARKVFKELAASPQEK